MDQVEWQGTRLAAPPFLLRETQDRKMTLIRSELRRHGMQEPDPFA
jgi:hypothetical protein